jgi:hypothetical protein
VQGGQIHLDSTDVKGIVTVARTGVHRQQRTR